MGKLSIPQRREKVTNYLRRGYTETKIAGILKVCRQTVVRDVVTVKKTSSKWLDGLAKDGFIFEYKLGLDNYLNIKN